MTTIAANMTASPIRKLLSARNAAIVYGVHRDFFRKTPELRRHRIVVNARTHLYSVERLDAFFTHRAGY